MLDTAATTLAATDDKPSATLATARAVEYDAGDVERFMRLVDKLPCGCWFFTGSRSRGAGNKKWYGTFYVRGMGRIRAHRFSCEAIGGKGPLPAGWHRDHICTFSLCVNPSCIDYVSHDENQRRKIERQKGSDLNASIEPNAIL